MPEPSDFGDLIDDPDDPEEESEAAGSEPGAPGEIFSATEKVDPTLGAPEEEFGEPKQSRTNDMTREELKSHLEANEERVRRMTEGVSQKLDKHLEVLQESNERFKAEVREDLATIKESNKWAYRLNAATLTGLIIVVSLMGVLLNLLLN